MCQALDLSLPNLCVWIVNESDSCYCCLYGVMMRLDHFIVTFFYVYYYYMIGDDRWEDYIIKLPSYFLFFCFKDIVCPFGSISSKLLGK